MNRISGIVILILLIPMLLLAQPSNTANANEVAILNQLTRPRLRSLDVDGAFTQLKQDGVRNTASIKQIADIDESNILMVSQQGAFNYSEITLIKSRSFIYAEQIGNQNILSKTLIGAYDNEIYTSQQGNENKGYIECKGFLNNVYVEMIGDNNKIGRIRDDGLILNGNFNSTEILQNGTNNLININQEGSFINSSFRQVGSLNEMDIQQRISKKSNDYCNLGVYQEGFSNQVILEQHAGNSSMAINQKGKKNYCNAILSNEGIQGFITQDGNNNRAIQNISGYGHQYNIHQKGNNNTVIQMDKNNLPAPYTINQIGSGMKILLNSESFIK